MTIILNKHSFETLHDVILVVLSLPTKEKEKVQTTRIRFYFDLSKWTSFQIEGWLVSSSSKTALVAQTRVLESMGNVYFDITHKSLCKHKIARGLVVNIQ